MSTYLRILLIIGALLFSVYVVRKLRKSQMRIEDAIYWLAFIVIILVLGIFPQVAFFLADIIGVESPVNLIYLIIIFLVIAKSFSLALANSKLQHEVSVLTEEIAIIRKELEQMEKKN